MPSKIQAVVIGGSAGGVKAMEFILRKLPETLSIPVFLILHLPSDRESMISDVFSYHTHHPVKEVEDKEVIRPGVIYVAPRAYHTLIERDFSLSLSIDELVNYARPAIDVLFESAADSYGAGLVGVLLTGSSRDGATGLKHIKRKGGLAIVQDPDTADFSFMPEAALKETAVDYILSLSGIAQALNRLLSEP